MNGRSVFLVSACASMLLSHAFAQVQRAPSCSVSQLSIAADAEHGNFDGMSHSGTLLVLRNIGSASCTVAGFPAVTFLDAANQPLPIARATPRGMHPGPVIVPVTVVPGAELTATLRWISSDVVTPGSCYNATSLSVNIGRENQQKLSTKLSEAGSVQICGPSGGVTYTMTKLAPDPR